MSSEIIPTSGRVVMARSIKDNPWLFALSSGNTAWDAQWNGQNPPTPALTVTDVIAPFGYARPTIVGYVKEDPAGTIISNGGAKYSVSSTPTRYLHLKLSLPVGSFSGNTLREIGLFAFPTINPSVPSGQVAINPSDVTARGELFDVLWRQPLPLEAGDSFARNFILRI